MRRFIPVCVLTLVALTMGCKNSVVPPSSPINSQGIKFAIFTVEDDVKTGVDSTQKTALLHFDDVTSLIHVDIETTAKQYESDYNANEIAADAKYKDKRLLVTGVVDSINKDITGGGYLTLRGNNPFIGVQALLTDAASDEAAHIAKGDRVSLVCSPSVRVLTVASLIGCRSLQQYFNEENAEIEKLLTDFFEGKQSLPKQIGTVITVMAVMGSDLPADSPCLKGDSQFCAKVFTMPPNSIKATVIHNRINQVLATVKLQ